MVHLNLAHPGGDPRMFFSIADSLRKVGHEVVVYTAENDPKFFPELQKGFEINVIPPPEPFSPILGGGGILKKVVNRWKRTRLQEEAVRRIQKKIRTDFDVLICQNDYSYSLGVWYKAQNPRAKTIWIMNNVPYYRSPKAGLVFNFLSWAASLIEWRRARKYIDGIDLVVVHDEERKKLAERLGVPVELLRIPIDFVGFYSPVRVVPEGAKKVVILGVGSLSPARKFEDIISAGAVLRERGYDVQVILICKDFWHDVAYKSFLLKKTEELGMKGAVEFWFNGATEEELRGAQKRANVFVFPTHINIWNMSSFEAMAAGLPLVLSRASSVTEVLRDGKDALFFEPGRPQDAADKIEDLISKPAFYENIASAGQEFVEKNLTWEGYARNFVEQLKPPRFSSGAKLKIVYAGLQSENYNFYRKPSFEYSNFYLSLVNLPGAEVIEYPYERILAVGKKRFNEDLLKLIRDTKPDLFFAFMYTDELNPHALDEIRKLTTSVAWFADDHWRIWNYSKNYVPHFTWAVTTWSRAPEIYARYGIKNVIRSQWACNYKEWHPIEITRDIDVSFVGQYNSSRAKIVRTLRGMGIDVWVRGFGWPEGRLSHEEVIKSFSRSKINLNFNTPPPRWSAKMIGRLFFRRSANRIVPDFWNIRSNLISWWNMKIPQIKARPFEVMACKTFLISAYADDMNRYYEDGKEIVYYDGTIDDLVKKINYYLRHDEEREEIAQSGYETTVREHTYEKRFIGLFKKIGIKYRDA